MKKLILTAILSISPLTSIAQEKKPQYTSITEIYAKEFIALPIGKEYSIVAIGGNYNRRNSFITIHIGTHNAGRYSIPFLCNRWLKAQGINQIHCIKNNEVLMTFKDPAAESDLRQCTNINGTLIREHICIKDNEEIARWITGVDNTYNAIFIMKAKDAEKYSSIENNEKITKATNLLEALKAKREERIIQTEINVYFGFIDDAMEGIYRLARVCKLNGGEFYAQGVRLETFMIGFMNKLHKGNKFEGIYACRSEKEPFMVYMRNKPGFDSLTVSAMRTFNEKEVEAERRRFARENGEFLQKFLNRFPEIKEGLYQQVRNDIEEVVALSKGTVQTVVQPVEQNPQRQTVSSSDPAYSIALEAANRLQVISKREGYKLWTAKPVGRDERGCVRVYVVDQNLASPRPDFKEYNYTICPGQIVETGSPRKYLQIPVQAKEVAQRIIPFCQRYGEASGKWEDIEINCRALRDKDKCLVEVTYFDVRNKSLVGNEEINACR